MTVHHTGHSSRKMRYSLKVPGFQDMREIEGTSRLSCFRLWCDVTNNFAAVDVAFKADQTSADCRCVCSRLLCSRHSSL